MQQCLAMILRALNLGSKFIVFFLLAKFSEPESLSFFGIYWTSIVIASGFMGLEMYGHSIRVLISSLGECSKKSVINKHVGSLFATTFFLTPVVLLILLAVSERFLPILVVLGIHLICEVLAQDNSRLLIGLGSPFKAITVNTVRGALWSLIASVYILLVQEDLLIEHVIYIWGCFSFLALLFSYIMLGSCFNSLIVPKLDICWLFSALKVSSILIVSSLFFRALVGGDKYFVESFFKPDISAFYIFYATIAFAVSGLIESGVSAWHYPKLVAAIKAKDNKIYEKVKKRFVLQNMCFSMMLAAFVILFVFFVVYFFLDSIYLEYFYILPL